MRFVPASGATFVASRLRAHNAVDVARQGVIQFGLAPAMLVSMIAAVHAGSKKRTLAARDNGIWAGRALAREDAVMSEREVFERILALLHQASLDDTRWSTASALIDDALGAHGNSLAVGDVHSGEDIQFHFAGIFFHGQRHRELEREYFEVYYPLDERVPPRAATPRQPTDPFV